MHPSSLLALAITITAAIALAGCGDHTTRHDHAAHDHAAAPAAPSTAPTAAAAAAATPTGTQETKRLEVGCAACIYEMPGISGCAHLAAKVDGKPMLVECPDMKIHAAGLCSAPREALVTGNRQGDKIVASKVELQPR